MISPFYGCPLPEACHRVSLGGCGLLERESLCIEKANSAIYMISLRCPYARENGMIESACSTATNAPLTFYSNAQTLHTVVCHTNVDHVMSWKLLLSAYDMTIHAPNWPERTPAVYTGEVWGCGV